MSPPGPRPRILDLFSGAGGAATGYHRAGFDVVGVDLNPMPRYPFEFIQADAMNMLDTLLAGGLTTDARIDYRIGWGYWLASFDAIHASPPCQGYSCTKSVNPHANKYPKLIEPLRELLRQTGLPYVIENVEGAKREMVNPTILCGTQFGLRSEFNGCPVHLRRHRCFETNWKLDDPGPHDHSGYAFPVFGHGPGMAQNPHFGGGKGAAAMSRLLMGVDWTNRKELDESIPPAYTEYIGGQLLQYVRAREGNAAAIAALYDVPQSVLGLAA